MQNKFDQLAQIIANFTKIYAHFAQKNNLSYNELHFLFYLAQTVQAAPSDISQRWSIPKQTINSICNKFSKKGLITIKTNSDDKRKKIISLTTQGSQFIDPLVKKITNAEMSIQQNCQEADFNHFLAFFMQITNDLSHKLD